MTTNITKQTKQDDNKTESSRFVKSLDFSTQKVKNLQLNTITKDQNLVKNKNQIVESYLKRGMSLKEVFKILNTSSATNKYTSLDGDDYFIFGTYKIQFNTAIENNPVLELACDMNNPARCVNLEP